MRRDPIPTGRAKDAELDGHPPRGHCARRRQRGGRLFGAGTSPAAPHDAAALVVAFTGGKVPESSRLMIDLPDAVEDGSSVPISVTVDYPMAARQLRERHPGRFRRQPAARGGDLPLHAAVGRAEATTRIRLAGTQTIIVIAKTGDGRFFGAQKQVQVTIGACTGS